MFPAKVIGKEVCKECGLEYDVTDDWSGPDHAERDCIQVLKKALSDLEKAHNRSIIEWDRVCGERDALSRDANENIRKAMNTAYENAIDACHEVYMNYTGPDPVEIACKKEIRKLIIK